MNKWLIQGCQLPHNQQMKDILSKNMGQEQNGKWVWLKLEKNQEKPRQCGGGKGKSYLREVGCCQW